MSSRCLCVPPVDDAYRLKETHSWVRASPRRAAAAGQPRQWWRGAGDAAVNELRVHSNRSRRRRGHSTLTQTNWPRSTPANPSYKRARNLDSVQPPASWKRGLIMKRYYFYVMTWYISRYYLKPWMVVICTCSAFSCVAFGLAAIFGEQTMQSTSSEHCAAPL